VILHYIFYGIYEATENAANLWLNLGGDTSMQSQ